MLMDTESFDACLSKAIESLESIRPNEDSRASRIVIGDFPTFLKNVICASKVALMFLCCLLSAVVQPELFAEKT